MVATKFLRLLLPEPSGTRAVRYLLLVLLCGDPLKRSRGSILRNARQQPAVNLPKQAQQICKNQLQPRSLVFTCLLCVQGCWPYDLYAWDVELSSTRTITSRLRFTIFHPSFTSISDGRKAIAYLRNDTVAEKSTKVILISIIQSLEQARPQVPRNYMF